MQEVFINVVPNVEATRLDEVLEECIKYAEDKLNTVYPHDAYAAIDNEVGIALSRKLRDGELGDSAYCVSLGGFSQYRNSMRSTIVRAFMKGGWRVFVPSL